MLQRVVDLVDRERDLGGVGLDTWFTDVSDERIDQAVLVLDEQRTQLLELAPSRLDVADRSA